jgi:hypothetical protein
VNKKIIQIACLLSLAFFFVLVLGCGKDDKYVKTVKEGSMDMVSGVRIGKAFDKFFSDGKWKSFESKNKQRVVEFNGKCTWNDKPAVLMVQFILHDNNRFEMGALTINNVNMNRIDSVNILQKVLEGK